MRERTTWDRNRIASLANKLAEDPRAMNQDHLQQQPSPTEYETGGPSEFAEDVHDSSDTWKAEYEGDTTRRNEIGMPEIRPDTFKTAEDHDFLVKKADLCVDVARSLLGKTASDETVVAQALSFMTMSNEELINTANRLASDDEDEDDEEETDEEAQAQQKQAQQQEEKKQSQQQKQQEETDEEAQAQQKQAQQQEEKKQSQQEEEKEQQAQKQAQQQKTQGQQQAEEEDEDVQKQATKLAQAMCQMSQDQQQQLMAQMQQFMQQQAQQQQQMAQQQPVQEQVQVQQQMPMDDDQLLSQMLEPQMAQQQDLQMLMADDEIQLDSPSMDLGEVTASEEDEVLRSLFAVDLEEEDEEEKQAKKKASSPVRTASTRTVGTRPSQGVSKLGGSSPSDVSNDVSKLSSLWASAPDVSKVFGR